MASVLPFSAVRPANSLASRVAALPYDVYNRVEAREAAQKDSLSFLNIDRPETQFPEDHDMYAPEVYQKAADMFQAQLADGIYLQDEKAQYYLYELTMQGRTQTGLVACAAVDDYVNGVIRKHENTREEKELDRIRHVDTVNAQTGPIFLAYRRNDTIETIIAGVKQQEPVFDFVSADGIGHRGWVIGDDGQIEQICTAFAGIDRLYIADGHHRAASAVKVGLNRRKADSNYDKTAASSSFLAVLFPDSELKILDYNRVVKDLNGLDEETFLEKLSELGTLEKRQEPVRPKQKGQVGICLRKSGWYVLHFKDSLFSDDPVDGLDVAVLQQQVLTPLLGIEDPRTDSRIDFVGGIRGLGELEKRVHTDCRAAFSMYPTSINELFAVADAGRLMPPKSTWFEPKLRSGLFIHPLESDR